MSDTLLAVIFSIFHHKFPKILNMSVKFNSRIFIHDGQCVFWKLLFSYPRRWWYNKILRRKKSLRLGVQHLSKSTSQCAIKSDQWHCAVSVCQFLLTVRSCHRCKWITWTKSWRKWADHADDRNIRGFDGRNVHHVKLWRTSVSC